MIQTALIFVELRLPAPADDFAEKSFGSTIGQSQRHVRASRRMYDVSASGLSHDRDYRFKIRQRRTMFGHILTFVAAVAPLISALSAPADTTTSSKVSTDIGADALPTGDDLQRTDTVPRWTMPNDVPRVVLTQPLPNGRVTSLFGARRDPILGDMHFHRGLDIAEPSGTPVRASASGIVRFAGLASGYGKLIAITHRDGLETRYGHLSTLLVGSGARVVEGQVIGLTGSTGRSTGPHLHWEVRLAGRAIDPQYPLASSLAPRKSERQAVASRWKGFSTRPDILPAAYD